MIDRTHDLPVVQQCKILSRSTAYYKPRETSPVDLALMRRMDALHLDYPFAGSRMLRDLLRQDGFAVGRKHVATLMKTMRMVAIHKKPNTSRRHPAHLVYPYLLRHTDGLCSLLTCNACRDLLPEPPLGFPIMRRCTWRAHCASPR